MERIGKYWFLVLRFCEDIEGEHLKERYGPTVGVNVKERNHQTETTHVHAIFTVVRKVEGSRCVIATSSAVLAYPLRT